MKENNEICVGLDISTKTIGCTILLNDGSKYGKIIELTHVSPKVSKRVTKDKDEALFIKVEIFRKEFLKKYSNLKISKVVIEEPLYTSNNANTCATLLRFNGMISLAVYEEWGVKPVYISSYDARRYSFPSLMGIRKYGKDGEPYPNDKILKAITKGHFVLWGSYPWDIVKKEVIQENVASIFPEIIWLYDKKNKLLECNYDATDSYVAILGQLNKEKYGELNMTTTDITITDDDKVNYFVHYWDVIEERITYLNKE